jgi:formylglycine-generating enzyme required for sulfatase activity
MRSLARMLWWAAVLSFGCMAEPGKVSISFVWEASKPSEAVWIFGRIVPLDPVTNELGQTLSELESPQEYESDMSFNFSRVPNGKNLAVVLEVRREKSLAAHIFWYGISEPFSLNPDDENDLNVPVIMVEAPVLSSLVIGEAVGPEVCPSCYVATSTVNLSFEVVNATAVVVANSTDFTLCKQVLAPEQVSPQGVTLAIEGSNWRVGGWDLGCDLRDTADGLRSVYVRLLDAEGYPSPTVSNQVVLDRHPPTEGTLISADGSWLFSQAAGGIETTMLFGAVEANEMFVEACSSSGLDGSDCATVPGGLLACEEGSKYYLPVAEWTRFTTQGCVQLKDDSVTALRVKYRDLARNETAWVVYEFQSVVALVMPWVTVPGGTFLMGCSPDEDDCEDGESPRHYVTISSFEMLETEVTESQYEAVIGENPSCYIQGNNDPVECVTWFNAIAFCEAIGGRLPTEAEWEYAARGGTETKYYCGNDDECLNDIAWYSQNSIWKHTVKKKEPNAYGLYDMLGNVSEWTNDWHEFTYYDSSPTNNPQGPDDGSNRVVRGGSHTAGNYGLRVWGREWGGPSVAVSDGLGVRCARSD